METVGVIVFIRSDVSAVIQNIHGRQGIQPSLGTVYEIVGMNTFDQMLVWYA